MPIPFHVAAYMTEQLRGKSINEDPPEFVLKLMRANNYFSMEIAEVISALTVIFWNSYEFDKQDIEKAKSLIDSFPESKLLIERFNNALSEC